jgi:hypothetical protein
MLEMKLPLLGTIAAFTLVAAGTTFAAESSTEQNAQGVSDSTVMTQEKNVKVEKKQQKQQKQSDENQRGRPTEQSKPAAN